MWVQSCLCVVIAFVSLVRSEGDACPRGRYGETCELECERPVADNDDACRFSPEGAVCSRHGQCVCGEACECDQISPSSPTTYTGRYCECDDYSCDYSGGLLCGGPSRGQCRCGQCMCKDEYSGSACDCPLSTETCRGSRGLICNGKGSCRCGRCVCDRDTYFRGPTCEDCPTCPGRCAEYKPCVQCMAFNTGNYSKEECVAKCGYVSLVDKVEENPDRTRICRFRDEDGLTFYFSYNFDRERVLVQLTKVLMTSSSEETSSTSNEEASNSSNEKMPRRHGVIILASTILMMYGLY